MKRIVIKIFSLISLVSLLPTSVLAADFDYNNIISDAEATNYQSMSQVQIKNFLTEKNSHLKNYFYYGYNPSPGEEILTKEQRTTADYKERSAAEIIYNAAHEAKINPQVLLTTLQKEMSLVEETSPTERQLNYAMGYACPDSGGCDFQYSGFGKQVRSTALQFAYYMEHINEYVYNPDTTSIIDGVAVRPANAATAGLYVYTPHLHGNENFKIIWDRYGFGAASTPIISGVIPEGSLVKARDGEDMNTIYLIYNNQKKPFSSMTALVSRYSPDRVLSVAQAELDKFTDGSAIKYPAYSILQSPSGQKYLLDGLNKRLIANDEVFRNLGFNPEEVIEASTAELNNIADGETITDADVKPLAQLLRAPSGGVFYVKDGAKAAIISPDIISINYPDLTITKATEETLNQFRQVKPAKINDGTLLKSVSSNEVYVIAGGQRRWVTNEHTFNELGYNWSNIITVDDRIMKLHNVGQSLSL